MIKILGTYLNDLQLHVIMTSLVNHNLFVGYHVGFSASLAISHLQFVDYTLVLGRKSWENIRSFRLVSILFEALSAFKVNFHTKN